MMNNKTIKDLNVEPIFLIGAERSGTTLLRLMLNSHHQIAWIQEFEFAVDKIKNNMKYPEIDDYHDYLRYHRIFQDSGFKVNEDLSYKDLIKSFFTQKRIQTNKSIIGATCHRHYDHLLTLFPDSKFIHIVRDPRDVSRSNIGMGWAGNVWNGVDRWIESEILWHSVKRKLNINNYIEISFEDLITKTEDTLNSICVFLKVKFTHEMFNYSKKTNYNLPDSNLINQWEKKLSLREIQLVESKTELFMQKRKYKCAYPKKNISIINKINLSLQNKIYKILFKVKRFGLIIYIADIFTRKLHLKRINNKLRLIINDIDRQHLK